MKTFLFVTLFSVFSAISYSQKEEELVKFYSQYDSLHTKIPLKLVGFDKHIYLIDSLICFTGSDSLSSFLARMQRPYTKNLPEPDISHIDFSTHSLIIYEYRGVDCHSEFDINMYDDPENKEYRMVVKVLYGGCRAGGYTYINWAVIPKPPADYKITYHSYIYDEIHNSYK